MNKLAGRLALAVFMAAGFALGSGLAFAGCALVVGVAARTGDSDITTALCLGTLTGGVVGAWGARSVVRAFRKRHDAKPA